MSPKVFTTADVLERQLLAAERHGLPLPAVFVETGSFEGDTTALAAGLFREVHTIELSPVFYKAVEERFKTQAHVHVHLGDSRQVLPALDLAEPCFFYLDAHWFRTTGTAGAGDFPLWGELAWIRARRYADVVAVDDAFMFGVHKSPEVWWWTVNRRKVRQVLDQTRIVYAGVDGDQFVVYRKKAK